MQVNLTHSWSTPRDGSGSSFCVVQTGNAGQEVGHLEKILQNTLHLTFDLGPGGSFRNEREVDRSLPTTHPTRVRDYLTSLSSDVCGSESSSRSFITMRWRSLRLVNSDRLLLGKKLLLLADFKGASLLVKEYRYQVFVTASINAPLNSTAS
jgi:hypothetical protein